VSREPLFHGWKLVGALCIVLFFAAGGGLYVFPVFISSLQEEFGWSMTEISGTAALFAVTMGLSNPLVGRLFARFGARVVMLVAAGLSVLTSLAYAGLQNLAMLYTIALVAGFAVAGTTILPAQALVTNWFQQFRGRAMGLTMLGIGLGGFLLPSFNELLIRRVGWRMAWVVGAGIMLSIVVPLIAVYVRTRPSDLGLCVDGVQPQREANDPAAAAASGLPLRQAVATRTFWLLVGVFLLQLVGVAALNFHFVPFATQEMGFPAREVAFYYGSTVGFSIVGRLAFGWLIDRWPPARLLTLSFLLLAAGPGILELLFLALGLRESHLLWLYAIPFGMGVGGNAVTMPVLVAACFGELHFSEIMGVLMSGFALGVIVGIPGAGFVFDRTGSYEGAIVACAVGLFLAMLLSLWIRPDLQREALAEAEA
jgi:MFS family permease